MLTTSVWLINMINVTQCSSMPIMCHVIANRRSIFIIIILLLNRKAGERYLFENKSGKL